MRRTPLQKGLMPNSCAAYVSALLLLLVGSPGLAEQAGPLKDLAAAPKPKLERYEVGKSVSGEIKVQGSNTLYPLMTRLAAEFQRIQPQVVIRTKGDGSAQSLTEFLAGPQPGQIKLREERSFPPVLTSSRELFDAERKKFIESHGYEPMEIPVALDAVAIYTHKDNPLPALTLDQVDAIFSKNHLRGYQTSLREWGQLGLGEGWQNSQMHLYGRDRRSGTYGFFQVHALAGGEFSEALHEAPGAASVIMSVGRDPLGIGYSGLGLEASNVRVIPLAEAEGMPALLPSAVTIENGSYPLRRTLYLYIDKAPQQALPAELQEFLRFIGSEEGQHAIAKAGFFPLPAQDGRRTIAKATR